MKGLEEIVFTALGEASMCWNPRPTGVFDSTGAKEIGDKLVKNISRHQSAQGPCKEAVYPGTACQFCYMPDCKRRRYESTPLPEPLAVLADRKGYTCLPYNARMYGKAFLWIIEIVKQGAEEESEPTFIEGKTYAEAEAKARTHLEGLPDQMEGGK